MTAIEPAPESPGCYLFKDKSGRVIYAGKAKNLRKRVRQYFQRKEFDWGKLKELVKNIAGVEYRVTGTELDALLLEYRLIKQYKPRYNAQLKADTEHPWLRIAVNAEWPGIAVVKDRAEDGAAYYGCFYDIYDAEDAISVLHRAWRVPLCGKAQFPGGSKPCLYYHLGKCAAPCARLIEKESYRALVLEITRFLEGEPVGKEAELEAAMNEAARELAFEKAAMIRATLDDLDRLKKKAGKLFDIASVKRLAVFVRPFRAEEFSVFYFCKGALFCRYDGMEAGGFLAACREASGPVPESGWVSQAVAEIFADKRFVFLPDQENPSADARLVHESFTRWGA